METDIDKDHGIRVDRRRSAGEPGECPGPAAPEGGRDAVPVRATPGRWLIAAWRLFWTHNQKLTNLAVLFSLVLTIIGLNQTQKQLVDSARNFRDEMDIQQRATAVMLANEFLDQVSDIEIRRRNGDIDDQADVDTMIATRAQLMLEGFEKLSPEHQAELNTQIVRFLSSIGYGRLFQPVFPKPGSEPEPGGRSINLSDRNFAHESLAHVDFRSASFKCPDLQGTTLEYTNLASATILNANLNAATIGSGVDFGAATIQWSDMRGMVLMGTPRFGGSMILFSDLRNLTIDASLQESLHREFGLDAKEADAKSADVERAGVERQGYAVLARLLVNARSLYGSLLDDDLVAAIREFYLQEGVKEGMKQLNRLLFVSPFSTMPPGLVGASPFDANAWQEMIPERMRIECGRVASDPVADDFRQARL